MSLIPVFDIGDTLVPSRKFAAHIIEDELRQRNHRPVHSFDPDKFMMYDPEQISRYLEKYGIEGDAEKLANDCRERYIEAFEDLMLENDVFDFFAKCNREFGTIGIVSDNTLKAKELMENLLNKHGVEYDTIVVSDEVGVEKPDPEIFKAFIEKRDEEASEFVYIGNDAERDSGAVDAGMEFIWTTQFDNVNSTYEGHAINELDFQELEATIREVEK
ncbi:HAD family hydrolase [Candidatus Nanosalina sp. VS9-1]|uniref:HAD family hydrolase n=1 Tax=Candidatus Nanosalina sp. VS9-1 TaxID=3388566 RepID=UPI0039E051D2